MADLFVWIGTRSGAMSAAPVVEAGIRSGLDCLVVATGSHCRLERGSGFEVELGLTRADVAAAEHDPAGADRIAAAFESKLLQIKPRMVVSAGDDAAARVGAQVAARRRYGIARLEAGLRSGLREPDEMSRRRCDHLSTFLYAPGVKEVDNLATEGIGRERIERVGSTVCAAALRRAPAELPAPAASGRPPDKPYCLVTLSRPETIGDYEPAKRIVEALVVLSRCVPVVFPMEDHIRQRLTELHLDRVIDAEPGLRARSALGYQKLGELIGASRLVLTDSGVVQEDATARGVSCLTLREATERAVTVSDGDNRPVGTNTELIVEEALAVLEGSPRPRAVPDLWDGLAGDRVVASLSAHLEQPGALTGAGVEA